MLGNGLPVIRTRYTASSTNFRNFSSEIVIPPKLNILNFLLFYLYLSYFLSIAG